jgi:hypothetical protein
MRLELGQALERVTQAIERHTPIAPVERGRTGVVPLSSLGHGPLGQQAVGDLGLRRGLGQVLFLALRDGRGIVGPGLVGVATGLVERLAFGREDLVLGGHRDHGFGAPFGIDGGRIGPQREQGRHPVGGHVGRGLVHLGQAVHGPQPDHHRQGQHRGKAQAQTGANLQVRQAHAPLSKVKLHPCTRNGMRFDVSNFGNGLLRHINIYAYKYAYSYAIC